MAQKWLPASSLTGGGEGALDAIDGSNVSDGDRAIVIADLVYLYVLDADSGLTESSPDVIEPDTNAGDKRWILIASAGGDVVIADEYGSGIIGSEDNEMHEAYETFIIGGGENKAKYTVNGCGMLGGFQNQIMRYSDYSATIGGDNNIIGFSSSQTVMAGGKNNLAKQAESAFLSGEQNIAMTSGDGLGLSVSGVGALAVLPGHKARANGFFEMVGDAQVSDLILKKETTDGTEVFLPLHDWYDPIPMLFPRTWKYTIDVVARQVGGTAGTVGESAMWNITGGIKIVGSELSRGTVSFSGAVADGDTVTIGYSNTYTFRDTPSAAFDVQTASLGSQAAENFASVINALETDVLTAEVEVGDVVMTLHPEMYPSTILTCSGANISCDGGGTFGGTTAQAYGTISGIGTPQGTGTPEVHATDNEFGTPAQGTITMSGIPVADETFVVDDQTFTWKDSRSGTGEVVMGADTGGCVTNIVAAVDLDLTTVTAEVGDGNTVVVTATTAGTAGNSIVLTENTTNMTVDGTGTLGGTAEGEDAGIPWEVNIEVDDWDMGLKINVTGESDKTIRWVANVKLVEVG